MKRLFKSIIASIVVTLLSLPIAIAQLGNTGNTNKILRATSDSINVEMVTTDGDDIIFYLYDYRMKKIKLDSISGECILVFRNAPISFKIQKMDKYRIKCTVEDFNGYIKFQSCHLNVIFNDKRKKFIFINP